MSALLFLALQAATPAPAPPPERFSILAPVPTARCRPRLPDDDVVVCASGDSLRLPLPAERGPSSGSSASNRNLDGAGALAAMSTPCATVQGGCQVGVDVFGMGTAAVRLVQKLIAPSSCCEEPSEGTSVFALAGDAVGGVKRLVAKKPDKSKRIPIPLD